MLDNYKKAGNLALGAAVACAVAIAVLGRNSTDGNVWGPGGAPAVLMWATGLCVAAMFWAYAKAKGRSGWLGLLLPFLNVVGLVILLKLPDRHPSPGEQGTRQTTGQAAAKVWATRAFVVAGLASMAYVLFVIMNSGD